LGVNPVRDGADESRACGAGRIDFVTARQQCCVAIAGLFLVTGVAACGGDSTNATATTQQTGDAAGRLADTIKARLTAAGYKPATPSALIGSPSDPPIPEEAFTVAIAPKSPESFTVTVLVFHSTKDAKLFLTHNAAACKALAVCRKAQKANYGQGRQRNIGSIIYGATSVSGISVVPVKSFQKIIALAQGTSK
jgi:hypothetical protein